MELTYGMRHLRHTWGTGLHKGRSLLSWFSLASQAARLWVNFMQGLCEEVECGSELTLKADEWKYASLTPEVPSCH